MSVYTIPVLSDNFSYLIIDDSSGKAAVIDPSEAKPIVEKVRELDVSLELILATHKHADHIQGLSELLEAFPKATVCGPKLDAHSIPHLTKALEDCDVISIGSLKGSVIATPCHTMGDISYYFPDEDAVFTGDTLFVGGCGRFFEGDANDMYQSLSKLSALPDHTKVYCGHEYTVSNLKFANSIEPGNPAIGRKLIAVNKLREAERPSVPSTIAEEKSYNPFLRSHSRELIDSVVAATAENATDPVSILGATRALKDNF